MNKFPPDVQSIVTKFLKENGYDGLWCDECGCDLESGIMPCSGEVDRCEAGHKIPCVPECCENGGGCDYHIGRKDTKEMSKIKAVYIAGPFRADTPWEIEKNIRVAEELSLKVWQTGLAAAICPHTNTRFFQGSASDQVWIDGTMEMMRRCDAVLLTSPDAPIYSSGTRGEVKEMGRLNRPVFGTFEECLEWLKKDQSC